MCDLIIYTIRITSFMLLKVLYRHFVIVYCVQSTDLWPLSGLSKLMWNLHWVINVFLCYLVTKKKKKVLILHIINHSLSNKKKKKKT